MQLNQVIQSPVVTEKSTNGHADRKYTFLVHPDATKVEIAQAVSDAYGVKVDSVNVNKVLKKTRLIGRGRTMTKRHAAKKAVVTLKEKESIDFNKFKSAK